MDEEQKAALATAIDAVVTRLVHEGGNHCPAVVVKYARQHLAEKALQLAKDPVRAAIPRLREIALELEGEYDDAGGTIEFIAGMELKMDDGSSSWLRFESELDEYLEHEDFADVDIPPGEHDDEQRALANVYWAARGIERFDEVYDQLVSLAGEAYSQHTTHITFIELSGAEE